MGARDKSLLYKPYIQFSNIYIRVNLKYLVVHKRCSVFVCKEMPRTGTRKNLNLLCKCEILEAWRQLVEQSYSYKKSRSLFLFKKKVILIVIDPEFA